MLLSVVISCRIRISTTEEKFKMKFCQTLFYRLPQLVDSKNKLVQLGSGNSTPDLTKTVSPSGSSLSNPSPILPVYPER